MDPWTSSFEVALFTIDPTKAGQYSASLEVKLVSYPAPPLVVTFGVTILPAPVAKNNLPFFEPKLASLATIQKTKNKSPWTFKLPSIVDLDKEPVVVTADFGYAASFLVLNGQASIDCDDISVKTAIKAGYYLVKISLNDSKDTVSYGLPIYVFDLPSEPVVEQPASNNSTTVEEATAVIS